LLVKYIISKKNSFTNSHLDEGRIRQVTKTLSEIDRLARVVDGEQFQGIKQILLIYYDYIFKYIEIPKLLTTLNKLLVTHNDTKVRKINV